MRQAEKSADEKFWGLLLGHLIEKGRRIPKFQVERAIGPILGIFLDKLVSRLVGGETVTLAAEFPLKKRGAGFQSTNIDWLMYDRRRKELIALELKTESGSFRADQLEIYLDLTRDESPWRRLKDDFGAIRKISTNWKYRGAERDLLDMASKECDGIDQARVRVLYLAPQSTAESFRLELDKFAKRHPDSFVAERVEFRPFESLRLCIGADADDEFARYRDMLCDALCALDQDIDDDEEPSSMPEGRNYRERSPLDLVLERCRDDKPIVVGFLGGVEELGRQDMARLGARLYKWDWAHAADGALPGSRNARNWIDGTTFAERVEAVRSRSLRSDADVHHLVSGIGDALRVNPELRLGQIIARVWPDTAASLDEVGDDEFVEALKAAR